MARIVVVRSNEYINRFRSIGLYIDGEHITDIDNNETSVLDLPAGKHKIVAKIDWCGSQAIDFNLSENDSQSFRLGGFKHNKVITAVWLVLAVLHFITNYFYNIQLSVFFILPLLLLLVFYISIGRNQYLTLEAIDCGDELSAERIN